MRESTTLLHSIPRLTPASLLDRLRDRNDAIAWDRLSALYGGFVLRIARARGLSNHDAEDVAQEVMVRLSTTIHEFEPRPRVGAFRSWLRQLVCWRTEDHRRQFSRSIFSRLWMPEPAPEDATPACESLPAPDPDPAAQLEAATRVRIVRMALRRLQRKFTPATLQIYELHVVDGWDIPAVTSFLGVPRSRVYLAKYRVTPFLRREVQILQSQVALRVKEPRRRLDVTLRTPCTGGF